MKVIIIFLMLCSFGYGFEVCSLDRYYSKNEAGWIIGDQVSIKILPDRKLQLVFPQASYTIKLPPEKQVYSAATNQEQSVVVFLISSRENDVTEFVRFVANQRVVNRDQKMSFKAIVNPVLHSVSRSGRFVLAEVGEKIPKVDGKNFKVIYYLGVLDLKTGAIVEKNVDSWLIYREK